MAWHWVTGLRVEASTQARNVSSEIGNGSSPAPHDDDESGDGTMTMSMTVTQTMRAGTGQCLAPDNGSS